MDNNKKEQFDVSDLGDSLPAVAGADSAENPAALKSVKLGVSDLGASLSAAISFSAAADLCADGRAALLKSVKETLQILVGGHYDILDKFTPTVRDRVKELQQIQIEHDNLVAKFNKEKAARKAEYDATDLEAKYEVTDLEASYQDLYALLYKKRYAIVNGVSEVHGVEDVAPMDVTDDKAKEEKGVPSFWLNAMKTNEILAEEISERDEEALKYLTDIECSLIDDPKGLQLRFSFGKNPFFKNSVLTKVCPIIDDDDLVSKKAPGTKIKWLPGKCLTRAMLTKKPKKGSKNAQPITETKDCESFFNFFNTVPEDEDDIDAEDLQDQMELGYEIASTIRDEIIPRAVYWFTGEAVGVAVRKDVFEGFEDDVDGDDDEDDDEEEDDLLDYMKRVMNVGGDQGEQPTEWRQGELSLVH